jgi:hypothetical protein
MWGGSMARFDSGRFPSCARRINNALGSRCHPLPRHTSTCRSFVQPNRIIPVSHQPVDAW